MAFSLKTVSVLIPLIFFILTANLLAQNEQGSATDSIPNPAALLLLQETSDYLRSAQQFTFRAEVTVETMLPYGEKRHFERQLEAFARRPDRLRVEFTGENGRKRFWYDGKTITLLDIDENLYAVSDAPGMIDQTLDFAMATYGIEVPIADFLVSDPYQSLSGNLLSASFVGENMIRGQPCFHLAFTQASIDWQLWIENGEMLVPRKLVITYKTEPGQPEYTAVFTRWHIDPQLPERLFKFAASAKSSKIEFLPINIEN